MGILKHKKHSHSYAYHLFLYFLWFLKCSTAKGTAYNMACKYLVDLTTVHILLAKPNV